MTCTYPNAGCLGDKADQRNGAQESHPVTNSVKAGEGAKREGDFGTVQAPLLDLLIKGLCGPLSSRSNRAS